MPLLLAFEPDEHWLITRSERLSRGQFLGVVSAVAQSLPDRQFAINVCEDRRNFMAGFAAALMHQQTVLMPSNRSVGAIAEIAAQYPDSYILSDGLEGPEGVMQFDCTHLPWGSPVETQVPMIAGDHVAAIVFTSGSTGRAVPNTKTWASLVRGVELAQQRFGFSQRTGIVATVPPQHMYGLETSVLVPLITGARIYGGRPFFPEDIRQALSCMGQYSLLVTTPIHLRACVASGLAWPDTEAVISATAPLDEALAQQAEAVFKAPVLEIYGCTEAGSLASRQTTRDAIWRLYDGFHIYRQQEQAILSADHLATDVPLSDIVDEVDEQHFRLLGRHQDMLNIAGKRASLMDLNLNLNAVPGVEDAVFVVPDSKVQAVTRLAALVVAPSRNEKQIIEDLSRQLDPVFLPRPLYRVDALPRNETGKLTRDALMKLIERKEGCA
jgi:acyl-coenzyme A synthetase/AMP-(fatty) acid ligase